MSRKGESNAGSSLFSRAENTDPIIEVIKDIVNADCISYKTYGPTRKRG